MNLLKIRMVASLCVALGFAPVCFAVSQVQLNVNYHGTVTDPGNAGAGPLHRFTVSVANVGDSAKIGAFDINFEGSGLYQIQTQTFGQPMPTLYGSAIPDSDYRLADSHLLYNPEDVVVIIGFPTLEGLVSGSPGADGLFHGAGGHLYTGPTGMNYGLSAVELQIAQIVVMPGGQVNISGEVAVAGEVDPHSTSGTAHVLSLTTIPEPSVGACIGMAIVGWVRQRRKPLGDVSHDAGRRYHRLR